MKACAHCGGSVLQARGDRAGNKWWACLRCKASGPWAKSEAERDRLWNTRSPVEDARGELVEALQPFAEACERCGDAEGRIYMVACQLDTNQLRAAKKAFVALSKSLPSPRGWQDELVERAQWEAFEKMMAALNGIEDGLTADQMRRRLYGEIHALRPTKAESLPSLLESEADG